MRILLCSAFLLTSFLISAQDFTTFLGLFEKTELPYTVPNGAFVNAGGEEFEPDFSGKKIDEANAVKFLGASEGTYTNYEAVVTMDQSKYVAVVVFQTSVNMNNGYMHGRFVLYTLSKTGDYIDSRIIGEEDMANEMEYYQSSKVSATIEPSYMSGDENKLMITYTTTEKKTKVDGGYGMAKEEIITSYDLIQEDGSIKDVTEGF